MAESQDLPVGRQRRVVVAVVAGGGRKLTSSGRGPGRHVGRPGAAWSALKARKKSEIRIHVG